MRDPLMIVLDAFGLLEVVVGLDFAHSFMHILRV